MRGAIGMMMGEVPFKISVNDVSVVSGSETVTGTLVSGPSGTITWLWEKVSGSAVIQPVSPSNPATQFYQSSYGGYSAVYWLKATINGRVAYSQQVTVSLYAEEPLPPLSVTGGGSGGTFAAAADGYWSVTTGFAVSGGSGNYSMINSKGEAGTTAFFLEGYIATPGGSQDVTVALDVTDNVTGERVIHSVQYQFVRP